MKTAVLRLASLRLTMAVMLLLAVASAVGTVTTIDIYHSFWFRGLLLLLSVNMISCMYNRLPAAVSSLRGEAALRRGPLFSLQADEGREQGLISDLKAAGYRQRGGPAGAVFSRGAAGYFFNFAGHLSLLIIMASSLIGSSMGFIGTQRVFVGDFTDTYFNWKTLTDTPLPFRLNVLDFRKIPNPIALKIGVKEIRTGRKGKVITTHVEDDLKIPGLDGRVRILSFDTEGKVLKALWVRSDGVTLPVTGGQEIDDTGLAMVPVAFAAFSEKRVTTGTAISRNGALLASADIEVNHPLRFEGLSIYMTDYGNDPSGRPYVGYQIVKDPARVGVWVGCVLFLLFMTAALFVRHRGVVLVREGGAVNIHLSSRGDRGKAVEELTAAIGRFVHLHDSEGAAPGGGTDGD